MNGKEVAVYIYNGILQTKTKTMEYCSAIKRKKLESVDLRWMNLEPVIQIEISQKEKKEIFILEKRY